MESLVANRGKRTPLPSSGTPQSTHRNGFLVQSKQTVSSSSPILGPAPFHQLTSIAQASSASSDPINAPMNSKKRSHTVFADGMLGEDGSAAKLQRIEDERRALTRSIVGSLDRESLEQLVAQAALMDSSMMQRVIASNSRSQEEGDKADETEDEELEPVTMQPKAPPGSSNNAAGFKFKHWQSHPTPAGVDDREWNNCYQAANSRVHAENKGNTRKTARDRDSGRTYEVALEILEQRKEAHSNDDYMGNSIINGTAKRAARRGAKRHETSIPSASVAKPPKQLSKPEVAPIEQLDPTGFIYTYPEAYPAPESVDKDYWNKVYNSANSRMYRSKAGESASTAKRLRELGETYQLALEILEERKDQEKEDKGMKGLGKSMRAKHKKVVEPASKENLESTGTPSDIVGPSPTTKAKAKPLTIKDTYQPVPEGLSSKEWARIYDKANIRIYNNTHGYWGTHRKSASVSKKFRESGKTYQLALEVLQEERDLAAKIVPAESRTPSTSESPNAQFMVESPPSSPVPRPTDNGPIPVGILDGHKNVVLAGFDVRMSFGWHCTSFDRDGNEIGMPEGIGDNISQDQVDLHPTLARLSDDALRKEVLRRQIASDN